MAEQERPGGARDLAITFTMSRQSAFVGTAEAVATYIGQQAGCSPDRAARLGAAVRHALGGAIRQDGAQGDLELRFAGNGSSLEVDVSSTTSLPAGSLERALTCDGEETAMRRLVDQVEFRREHGHDHCRLTQQIHPDR